jgi:hypothetical protein
MSSIPTLAKAEKGKQQQVARNIELAWISLIVSFSDTDQSWGERKKKQP